MERGELPFQSWKPAKIVKGNGHTYIIKYDNCAMEGNLIEDKVPRKLLRPHPPPMQQKSHNIGDIVEVFENYSWRLAEILGALSKNIVVVRLFGSSKEINVPLFLMRVPSTWKDNHWNTPHMESGKNKNSTINNQSKGRNLRSRIPPSCLKVLKCGARDDMIREKYGRRKKRPFPSITRASKKMRTTIMGKEISFDDVSLSSVASCSFNNGSYNSACHKVTKSKKFHGPVDEAESFSNIPKVPLEINHNLKFDSYYSTMRSLYESGSLNWEQELLLTNLRQALHISNDEHLFIIRQLLSTRR
ncbi:hypothetical protein MA16_Dca004731 [Dendrobium catenatum]|uniref:ENT domain-containing protein n=1 Tax=Dendrobium catenatum TaxID=906689 RepID=A0A2I0VNX9_9ASPA|nr:hypothetical protein MA16_Dca004731 [Dendrobium catenatum]